MINGMYLSTMGAMVQSQKHATTANNLANLNTVGFKPDWSIHQVLPTESLLQPGFRREIDRILESTGGGVWLERTYTDFSTGPQRQTDSPIDLSLQNPDGAVSFFMVRRLDTDEVLYSRNGHFVIDNVGNLRTDSGMSVLDVGGAPLNIGDATHVRVTEDGSVIDNDTNAVLAQVGVVATEDIHSLQKFGYNVWKNNGATFQNYQAGVRAGHLEDSSVNQIREMTMMIEGQRAYDINMSFLRIQDESLSGVVNRLGSVQ